MRRILATMVTTGLALVGSLSTAQSASAADKGSIWAYSGASAYCMTPKGNGKANGTILTVWRCTNAASQMWHRDSQNRLVNTASGKCLTPQGDAYNTNGALLTLWTCGTNKSQQWQTGSDVMHSYSYKAPAPKGHNVSNGVYFTIWTASEHPASRWSLLPY
ncbi:RICIN domain-containing protein [Streptomyces sp. NPDC054864]